MRNFRLIKEWYPIFEGLGLSYDWHHVKQGCVNLFFAIKGIQISVRLFEIVDFGTLSINKLVPFAGGALLHIFDKIESVLHDLKLLVQFA